MQTFFNKDDSLNISASVYPRCFDIIVAVCDMTA